MAHDKNRELWKSFEGLLHWVQFLMFIFVAFHIYFLFIYSQHSEKTQTRVSNLLKVKLLLGRSKCDQLFIEDLGYLSGK